MEDAHVTYFKQKLDDDSNRLATMERHLYTLDANRAGLVAEIEKTKKSLKQAEGMLASMTKPAETEDA